MIHEIVPRGLSRKYNMGGVSGLINYCIATHYKSDHYESELINKTVEYFIENKLLFKALRDGEVIIIE